MKNWLRMVAAILLGNLIYFLLRPSLPFPFVHERFQIDPGLLLDFLFCLGIYGILQQAGRDSGTRGPDR